MELILVVNFNGECRTIRVEQGFTFGQIQEAIRGLWGSSLNGNFQIHLSVGAITNCVIECDSELNNIFTICSVNGYQIATVVVNECSHPIASVDSSNPSQSTVQNTPICNTRSVFPSPFVPSTQSKLPFRVTKNPDLSGKHSESRNELSLPAFDICPTPVKKPLLSDRWHDPFDGGVGSMFEQGAPGFRTALIKHATLLGFTFKYVKNTKQYIHVECTFKSEHNCGWYVKARCVIVSNYFEIYKGDFIHKCLGKTTLNKRNRFGHKVIGQLMRDAALEDSDLSGKRIVDILKINYGVSIPYHKGWRGAEEARASLFGSYCESYDDLRWYSVAVTRTNPGSVCDVEVNSKSSRFERVFVAFRACLDGFQKCRPILFLDGTFLHGRAKGTLLTATSKDGNNGLFPVAYAVVSAENTSNWTWFLEKLRDNCVHEREIYYISDRNCGLMSAFPAVFQNPKHFFCLFHLMNNLRGRFGGGMKAVYRRNMVNLFRECAYAPNIRIFNEKVEVFLRTGGRVAEEWLCQIPYEKWAVSHSPSMTRYGEMTSNAAESINSWLKEARGLPITRMLDHVRQEISRWQFERRLESAKWSTLLCPVRDLMWEDVSDLSRSWTVVQRGDKVFEVKCVPSVVVDLAAKTCTCSHWQVAGFPCAHGAAVINSYGTCLKDYIDSSFLSSTYQECYQSVIQPIPQTEKFECFGLTYGSKILPPILQNPPGRPKKSRVQSYGEFHKL